MSESGYRHSIDEIRAHTEKKSAEAAEKRASEKKRQRRNKALVTAAGIAAVAAMGIGVKEALETRPQGMDERETPERSARVNPSETELTEEQKIEKARIDAEEAAAEKKTIGSSSEETEIPQTVQDQVFDGLDTTKIE